MSLLRNLVRAGLLTILCLVSFLLPSQLSATIVCSASQSSLWQICGPIEGLAGLNEQPSAIQASDGTLRLVWTHTTITGVTSIYYATRLTNGTWLQGSSVTPLGGRNQSPSVVQASNGTVFVFWAYKAIAATHYQIYYRYLKGTTWSGYNALPLATPTNLNDSLPATAVDRDGTLWLAWTRDNSTSSGTSAVMYQLWYETLSSSGWSPEGSITSASDKNWNYEPSLMSGKDGVVRIVYSSGQQSLQNFQINYIYRVGNGWSAPVRIVPSNATANDQNPSIIQDRNGTIWAFWTRNTSTNLQIRGLSSIDNGAHWIGETALTAVCSTCPDSEQPAAVQSSTDKNIWVFYATNPSGSSFGIWSLRTTNAIYPVHDVALNCFAYCYLSFSAAKMYAGGFPGPYAGQSPIESIYVTVRNFGDFNENVTLNLATTNTTKYPMSQVIQVPIGSSGTFAFNWNTTGVKPGRYGISANATIPIETFGNRADDNLLLKNQIWLIPLGDVNQDGAVTIVDISIANYGYAATPGNPRWNPYADISGGGVISIVDINYINFHYGIYT